MRRSLKMVFAAISGFYLSVFGQNDAYLINQTPMLKAETIFQSWSADSTLSIWEFSTPLEFYYPFDRQSSVAITTEFASAKGKNLSALSGLGDAQVSFNYQPGLNSLVLSLGLNLPSGKKEMPVLEFNTMSALSQNLFRFQVPVFGQGFGLSPGLTYALPVNEKVVLGLGIAYQLKTAYKPVEKMEKSYKPGDEVLVTGGVDVQLGEAESLSGDVLWAYYSADKVDNDNIFHAGSKLMLSVRYQKAFRRDAILVSASYRSRAKNRVYFPGITLETQQLQPNETEIMGIYVMPVSNQMAWKGSADLRFLHKTGNSIPVNIIELAVGPEWSAAPGIKIPFHVKLALGRFKGGKTMTGVGLGAGIVYRF
jgi:hypothetical protein